MTYLNRKVDTYKYIRQENKRTWDLNCEKSYFVALAPNNVAGVTFEPSKIPRFTDRDVTMAKIIG